MPKITRKKSRRVVARTRIKKVDDEYVVFAYDQGNNRYPEADYFAADLEDARDTAQAMVNDSKHGGANE